VMAGQAEFTEALLDPARATPPGLTNPGGGRAAKRFDVYRNNVVASLTEALETAFPVIRKLVGESNFRILAGTYLREHPPGSPLLMFYGTRMPAFVTTFEPTRGLRYLPDIARLELAMRQCYHAADSTPLAPAGLRIPTERLMASRVRFAPSARLVRSAWPIHGIWRFNMESGAPKPQARAESVLVGRPEFDPRPWPLTPGGGEFVARLMGGARFDKALDATVAETPEFDLADTLGTLLGAAAITGLDEDT